MEASTQSQDWVHFDQEKVNEQIFDRSGCQL